MAYVIEDDILAPKGVILIEYRGPNPFAIYPKLRDFLMTIFEAKGLHIYEDDFRWDITGDPRSFFIKTRLEKGLDKFTKGTVSLQLQGKQPIDPRKSGSVEMRVGGKITTEYPIKTVFQKIVIKPFVWLYHNLIYDNIRRRYIKIYKAGIERLEAEIRSTFNLIMRERLT